ncbi:MAG: hypothetical protein ACLTSX_11665 [Collinsella sp.]
MDCGSPISIACRRRHRRGQGRMSAQPTDGDADRRLKLMDRARSQPQWLGGDPGSCMCAAPTCISTVASPLARLSPTVA